MFFLQLAVIFVPGIIWERLHANFGRKESPSEFDIIRRSFVYGLVCYVLTYCLYWALGAAMPGWFGGLTFDFFSLRSDSEFLTFDFVDEILAASLVAMLSGTLWLYATKYKWLSRFMQAIGATNRYGDEDVWDYTFNAADQAVKFVHVRDFANQRTYTGWVDVFSETDRVRELVLSDVVVYDADGTELYKTARLYLGLAADNVHIEFPGIEPEGKGDDLG